MYYGWKIVAALFVILMFSSGLGFYNHAVILQALSTEKGFPITLASTAVSLFFFSSGVTGMLVASLLEKYDVRLVITAGAVLASGCLALLGSVTSEWQLFVLYLVFGAGFCASGLLPATTLVARWFENNRARALSVASTGLSVGGIVVTPYCAHVIETIGMVPVSPYMGLVYFVGVVPLCLLVLRSAPPAKSHTGEGGPPVTPGIPYSAAVRELWFWQLNLAYIFVMLAQVGGIAHQYGIVSEHLQGEEAALALGILPAASIIGRLIGGVIVDRTDAPRFTLAMMGMQGLSLAGMGIFANVWLLLACLALFGITVGNLLMLQPLLLASRYGLLNYSRIYALANFLTMIGIAAGPVAMGYIFESTRRYGNAYLLAGAAGSVALLVFGFAVFGRQRPPAVA